MGVHRRLSQALITLLCAVSPFLAQANPEISGAGATFPLPVIKVWAEQYQSLKNITVNYQGIGSAEGIKRITARSVDFGVTDIGLTQSELIHDDLLQFPLVVGGITPVINLPGISSGQITLSGPVLADIYLGKITRWDDRQIQLLNPKLTLPNLPIAVIHRKDGSGTSFNFTAYLSKVSPVWNSTLGIASSLLWPVGIEAVGNEGIAKQVLSQEGAIGYVEYFYAQQFQLTTLNLINSAGKVVAPTPDSFEQDYQHSHWHHSSFYQSLIDLPGANSWPIVGISYVLIHRDRNDREDAIQTLYFLDWVYRNGAAAAKDLAYIPVSDPELIKLISNAMKQVKDGQGNPVLK